MTKSLQLDGQFWLPDDPDTKVTGVVTFSPSEGAALSLIGSFTDFMDMLNRRPSPDYRRIVGAVIFRGDITNVTLDDCHHTFENPFGRRQRFVVSRLLVNVAYDPDEPVELDRLTVQLSDFARWLAEGAPRMVPDWTVLASGRIPTTALAAQETENIQLDGHAQLDLVHTLSMTVGLGSMSLQQNSTAAFKFDNPVHLDSALEHAFDLLSA